MKATTLAMAALVGCAWAGPANGQSSIATALTNRVAWGANVGWINCRPNPVDGAVIGEYFCWGYLYSGNAGWIRLGVGTPTNGFRYSNTSDADYGVNHDGLGNLRGYAWGANVGWIRFEDVGAPSVDLVTGNLDGYVWGANIGWISLSNLQGAVRTAWMDAGPDSDGDGMPDAYEYFWVGTTGIFDAVSQSDSDEVSDLDEYTMGTSPLNAASYLRIINYFPAGTPTNVSVTWTTELRRHYRLEHGSDLTNELTWTDTGFGRLIPSGGTMTRIAACGTATQRFWRVLALRPLPE